MMKPAPVSPGAGIPALNEIKIIAKAIRHKRIIKVFFITIYNKSKTNLIPFFKGKGTGLLFSKIYIFILCTKRVVQLTLVM